MLVKAGNFFRAIRNIEQYIFLVVSCILPTQQAKERGETTQSYEISLGIGNKKVLNWNKMLSISHVLPAGTYCNITLQK